jgi:hypothetical protein
MRLSAAAVVWSAGLVLAALVWPAYSTGETSADGVTLGHATLVQVNGTRALVLMAIPLAISGVVLAAIRMRRAGARWAGPVAWTAIGVLTIECLVGIMTIGLFILPVPILLAAATRRASGAGAAGSARPDASATRPASRSSSLSAR